MAHTTSITTHSRNPEKTRGRARDPLCFKRFIQRIHTKKQTVQHWLAAAVLWSLAATGLADDREAQLKAAFILNFAKFVEWPAAPQGDAFTFCFIGIEHNRDAYLNTFSGKTVKGLPTVVDIINYRTPLSRCSVLFVRGVDQAQLSHLNTSLGGQPILTIGEDESFMAAGGMIRFYAAQGRIRFEINPTAVNAAGLTVSSKLLNLARIRGDNTGGATP